MLLLEASTDLLAWSGAYKQDWNDEQDDEHEEQSPQIQNQGVGFEADLSKLVQLLLFVVRRLNSCLIDLVSWEDVKSGDGYQTLYDHEGELREVRHEQR